MGGGNRLAGDIRVGGGGCFRVEFAESGERPTGHKFTYKCRGALATYSSRAQAQ